MVRLDLGCGSNKQKDFHGVDVLPFEGVDTVFDLRKSPWPWEDNSVEAAYSSHFVEHLERLERCVFWNELYRVLKVGGQAQIITPHWSHERAYGDPTHCWPPVVGLAYNYLHKQWRDSQAPHCNEKELLKCDFDFILAGAFDPNDLWVSARIQEVKAVLMQRNINTCTDLIATVTKRA